MGFYYRQRRRVETLSGGALTLFGLILAVPAAAVLSTHIAAGGGRAPVVTGSEIRLLVAGGADAALAERASILLIRQ
jgi:hypothetical protein